MTFRYQVLGSSWWSWMYACSLTLQNIEESFFWTQQVFEDMTCVFLEIEDMQMIIKVVPSQPSSVWSVLTKWSPSESTWLWRVPPPPPLAAAAWSPSSPIGRISTTLAKRLVVHLAAITTRGPDFDAFATSLAGATPYTVKYICNCQIWNTSPHSQYNSTLKLSWTKVEHTHVTEKLKILRWEQVWNVALLISSPISVIIYPTI